MPSYEALFILRKLSRPETAKVLKRAATHIYNSRGYLFGIENLGTRNLPHKISMQGRRYKEGRYVTVTMVIHLNTKLKVIHS